MLHTVNPEGFLFAEGTLRVLDQTEFILLPPER